MTQEEQEKLLSIMGRAPESSWRMWIAECWRQAILEDSLNSLRKAGFVLNSILFLSDLRNEAKDQIQAHLEWYIEPTIVTLSKQVEE